MTSPRMLAFGSLVVAALDGTYALVSTALRGRDPRLAFQAVAGGILGRKAFSGGWGTFALGVAIHLGIATAVVLVCYAGQTLLPVARRHPIAAGALYGVAVYLVMYRVVLPLSALTLRPQSPGQIAMDLAAHVFLIGIPASWFASRATPRAVTS